MHLLYRNSLKHFQSPKNMHWIPPCLSPHPRQSHFKLSVTKENQRHLHFVSSDLTSFHYHASLKGGSTFPNRMNFRKSSKRPLTPPSFSESYIANFATKVRQKCVCSNGGTFVYCMILFPMRCMLYKCSTW